MSFAVLPPEINSAPVRGCRVGADAGRGGRLGWTGRRIGFGRGLVFGGDGGWQAVAGRGVDGDDGSAALIRWLSAAAHLCRRPPKPG